MKVKYIVIHNSDTWQGYPCTPQIIGEWHEARGFSPAKNPILTLDVSPCIGYHFFVDAVGVVYPLRQLTEPGIHCKGWNHNTIAVCMAGGGLYYGRHKLQKLEKEYRTPIAPATIMATALLAAELVTKFGLNPACIKGHGELQPDKRDTCPGIDMHLFRKLVLHLPWGK